VKVEAVEDVKTGAWAGSETIDKWTSRIQSAMASTVESVFELGRVLEDCHKEIGRSDDEDEKGSSYRQAVLGAHMSMSAARKFRIIARSALPSVHSVNALPSSWGTLYELSHLTKGDLNAKIKTGRITPELTRAQATGLVKPNPARKANKEMRKAVQEFCKPHVEDGPWQDDSGGRLTDDQRVKRNEVFGSEVTEDSPVRVRRAKRSTTPHEPGTLGGIADLLELRVWMDEATKNAKRCKASLRKLRASFTEDQWQALQQSMAEVRTAWEWSE
jgi:hypothetical protein